MSSTGTATASAPDGLLQAALSTHGARSGSEGTLAALAVPAHRVAADATVADLDSLLRADASARWVILDGLQGPTLVSRAWFEVEMTGGPGYGRLFRRNRRLSDVAHTDTLIFPGDCPVGVAAAAVIPRRADDDSVDGVIVQYPDGGLAVAPVTAIFEQLALQYAYQSLHDPLTGLANRSFLLERLRASPLGAPAVLCYIDLDRFKDVNDHLGHAAGDEVLVEFARRLRGIARAEDVVVRLGGDEFAVLCEAPLSPAQSTALAERIVLAAAAPFVVRGRWTDALTEEVVSLGASVGISRSEGDGHETGLTSLDVLLLQGDLAMYRAKSLGRGRVAHFESGLLDDAGGADAARARHRMERRLRQAIEAGGLSLHYQPVVTLPSGQVTGVEALARWADDELGQVPPDQFIPLAERSGLVVDLGRWVLTTACHEAAGWPTGPSGVAPTVAVNVSPVQLAERGFVDDVTRALTESGLAPERLCLEITETAAIIELTATAARLTELRAIGVRLALDDFGAGHSSLTLLRELPVHLVKIDRSFVERVTTDPSDAVLVRLVVEAAHSLGRQVCAEGVETAEQAQQLVAMGCDSAQGWLFGRPAPASPALARVLSDRSAGIPVVAGEEAPAMPLGGSDELVVVMAPDRTITYVSASSNRMLGWLPQELVGTSALELLLPADQEIVLSGQPLGERQGDGVTVHRARHRDGRIRWLESTTRQLGDDGGRVREVLTVCRDVTEAVEAQHALADSEAMFRYAFDDAPIGMALTGLDGTFLRVNKTFAALLSTTAEALHELRVQDVTHPDDLATDRANIAELTAGRTLPQDVDKRYRGPNGVDVPVRVHATPVQDSTGEPVFVFAHILPL
jgi:diguanylate cyclase (GGDEF)-like protein/PAS domain S-box-containing protein